MKTHLDLFSGIGGFALAAQAAGFETIGFAEIDNYASAILKRHWPNIPNFGDVRTVPAVRCDLVTGGFPCQPFSVAGKQRGAEDDRFLWPAMLNVIKNSHATWVLGENVTGLIDMELDRCIADLENIGYEVQPVIIPACAVNAPHRRDRCWIIAHSKSKQSQRLFKQPIRSKALSSFNSDATGVGRERSAKEKIQRKPIQPPQSLRGVAHFNKGFSVSAPRICGVDDGIPKIPHRLKSLGNAIVPQVAFEILKLMYEIC